MNTPLSLLDPVKVETAHASIEKIKLGLKKVLFGLDDLIESTLVGLLAGGHILLEGLPGLGKTQLVRSLGQLLHLPFRRIQFTPDLLPSDITGTHILVGDGGARKFEFHRGPIFGSLILADEINRASPKTQSALLEAMQEQSVTVLGETHSLPRPFFVLATQNPIELEGTYPLPEAQLDRFALKLLVPSANESTMAKIISERRGRAEPELTPELKVEEVINLIETTRDVAIASAVAEYIAALVAQTIPGSNNHGASKQLRYGAGPRAALSLAQNARACALLRNRSHVGFEDVAEVTLPTLRHRIGLTHTARLEGITTDGVLRQILKTVPHQGKELPKSLGE